jgi:hypothetical protein
MQVGRDKFIDKHGSFPPSPFVVVVVIAVLELESRASHFSR